MAERFDLIVFDWDGTLMDSTAAIASAIQLACRDLGLPIPSRERASHVIGLGLNEALRYAVPQLPDEQIPKMVERYRAHYLAQDGKLQLFDGIRALLSRLKQRGHALAVATGKTRVGLERALETTGIRSMFDATRCADEAHSKPNPAMLLDLMNELGMDRARTVMIGDTTHDLLMAANARTAGVGVTYGAHLPDELAGAPAEVIVHTVGELQAWLDLHA